MGKEAAFLLGVIGLLPIANWIAGGHEAPWYADRLDGWTSGGAIVVGIAIVAAILLRSRPELWPEGKWGKVAAWWERSGWRGDALIAGVALVLYAVISQTVHSAKPLNIDELIQVYQARIFAAGMLYLPAPDFPEFTSALHVIDWGGKVYGQFPAGGPAMLALGTLVGAEWLVGPCFAALGVFALARLLRRIEPRAGVALAATLLYAFAPFTVFLSGSMMNHVTTLTWLLLGAWALAAAVESTSTAWRPALAMGLAFGIAGTIRPLDGAVFALPAGAWLLWRARHGGESLRALIASGVGIAVPLLALAYVNAAQTGDPFRFGYIEMWGRAHELGFHMAPSGVAHTPARGLELVNLYLVRLQSFLFESPVPSLLFATAALGLSKRITSIDRWVLASCGGLLLGYWGYWFEGAYLGPRFLLPLAPWLALWTARLPSVLAERSVAHSVQRAVLLGGLAALAIGAATMLPIRVQEYQNDMRLMRIDPDAMAEAQGVEPGALVFVRESWGAQVVARMWALGVARVTAEQYYRTTDLCRLDESVAEVERSGGGAERLGKLIAPWRADSSALVLLGLAPNTKTLVLPGSTLTAECTRRVIEDQGGFTVLTPLLLATDRNRYVRDLHARDTVLLDGATTGPVWLFTLHTDDGWQFRFHRVAMDSARAEWNAVRKEAK